MARKKLIVLAERVAQSILLIRGQKVLLDADLAQMYDVETKALVRAMKRNMDRFPSDFMFQLTKDEFNDLRCQIGTSNLRSQIVTSSLRGGRRYSPYAFTEQGVAMLSSVLRSKRAVQVNIEIMRAFVRLRRFLESDEQLARKMRELERRVGTHDEAIITIMETIKRLMSETSETPRGYIGFEAPAKTPAKKAKKTSKARRRARR